MDTKAVIFDMDGILTDTEKFQFEGWAEVLKEFGVELTKDDYLEYVGRSGDWIDRVLIERHGLDVKEGSLVSRKRDLVMKWLKEREIDLMPGAMEVLEFLRSRGIRITIATGAPRDHTDIKIKKAGIGGFFDSFASATDVERVKPDPDLYLKAMENIRTDPEECVAIEDTRDGMLSAKAAGLKCLVIPNGLTERQDFSEADGIFKSFSEAFSSLKF